MPKISYTPFSYTIVHPLKHPGENQPFFHFNRFIFASHFLFPRNIQFWTHTHTKHVIWYLFHLIIRIHTQLPAISIRANDVFHISVYLAKIYFESVQRREMNSQKLIQKLITTQLEVIKKFVPAISSRRLVNFVCIDKHIVKYIQSGGMKDPTNKSKQKFLGRWKEKLPKKGAGGLKVSKQKWNIMTFTSLSMYILFNHHGARNVCLWQGIGINVILVIFQFHHFLINVAESYAKRQR